MYQLVTVYEYHAISTCKPPCYSPAEEVDRGPANASQGLAPTPSLFVHNSPTSFVICFPDSLNL